MNYFVYIKDILAVATKLDRFKWSYGNVSASSSRDDFDKCRIKVFLDIVSDNEIEVKGNRQFSYFTYDDESNTLGYSRKIFRSIKISYSLTVRENEIHMTCGKNYARVVRNKYMNIHSYDYILTDTVMGMLLKSGLCTVYAAAVKLENDAKNILMFGAPNTGKTLAALCLCSKYAGKLMSEDFSVTDGETVWGVPTTHTHRNYKAADLAEPCIIENEPCRITDVVVLEKGKEFVSTEKNRSKIRCLQRYGMGYMKSPCLTVLGYYRSEFCIEEMIEMEEKILDKLISGSRFTLISSENSMSFADTIIGIK